MSLSRWIRFPRCPWCIRGWESVPAKANVAERVKIWIFPSEVFSRFPRVFIGFPLEIQPCSLLPPTSEKKPPTESFQKVKIEKFLTELKKRHEHKMSTNHHFQKTLVSRNSTPLTFWIIYSNLRNYVEKSIWGLRLRVASTSWCSECSPGPDSNHFITSEWWKVHILTRSATNVLTWPQNSLFLWILEAAQNTHFQAAPPSWIRFPTRSVGWGGGGGAEFLFVEDLYTNVSLWLKWSIYNNNACNCRGVGKRGVVTKKWVILHRRTRGFKIDYIMITSLIIHSFAAWR